MTEAPSASTLYCPKCSYNLTGLTQNRCPECGSLFDPDQVMAQRRYRYAIAPIHWLSLLGANLAFYAGLLLAVLSNSDAGAVVGCVAGVAILVLSVLVSRRLARALARRNPGDPPNPASVVLTLGLTVVLLAAQLGVLAVVFVGACFVALANI